MSTNHTYGAASVRTPLDSTRAVHLDHILREIQSHNWTLGSFLLDVFTIPKRGEPGASQIRAQMVSRFLQGGTTVKIQDVIEAIYWCRYGAPSRVRNTADPATDAVRVRSAKETMMARGCLDQWAIGTVERIMDKEAAEVSSKDGGFHLADKDASWDFVFDFSMDRLLSLLESRGKTMLRLLVVAATPARGRPSTDELQSDSFSYGAHFSKPTLPGSGQNRREPLVVRIY